MKQSHGYVREHDNTSKNQRKKGCPRSLVCCPCPSTNVVCSVFLVENRLYDCMRTFRTTFLLLGSSRCLVLSVPQQSIMALVIAGSSISPNSNIPVKPNRPPFRGKGDLGRMKRRACRQPSSRLSPPSLFAAVLHTSGICRLWPYRH